MYDKVKTALAYLGFTDEYLKTFIENEIEDSVVEECIRNPDFVKNLEDIIRPAGRRIKFLKKFSELMAKVGDEGIPSGPDFPSVSPTSVVSCNPHQMYVPDVPLDSDTMTTSTHDCPFGDHAASSETLSSIEQSQDGSDSGLSTSPETPMEQDVFVNTSDGQSSPSEIICFTSEPRPIQIMNFKDSCENESISGMDFYFPNLKHIVEKTGNRPVAVLAIAGPTRKGKSFFMNYVLRFLQGLKDGDEDWMGWARSRDPLVGFSWRTDVDRVTTGIWMWSEPITIKTTDGLEYDILLMDTQGVFDEHTTPHQWSILVGLALLTSSTLIFNLSSDLQEDQLNIFDKFLQFGLMSLQDSQESDTPFQKLVFLIRDWQNTQQHPHGFVGGKSFIQRKLEIKPHHQDAHKRVREQLGKCFEEIVCALLPTPGPAAFDANYNGATNCCQEYLDKLEKLILELMNPEQFKIKKINGNSLTGKDLLAHFTLYCELLSSKEPPASESFYEVASRSCNSIVVNKCIDAVQQEIERSMGSFHFLQDTAVLQMELFARSLASQTFDSSKKMGTSESILNSKHELETKMDTLFQQFKTTNAHQRDKIVADATEQAVNSYSEKVENFLTSQSFVLPNDLDNFASEEELAAESLFKQICGLAPSDDMPTEMEKMRKLVRDKLIAFHNSNTLKRCQAEKELEKESDTLERAYKFEMDFKTDGSLISDEEFAELHTSTWKKALDKFRALKPHPLLVTIAQTNLERKVSTCREAIERSVKTCNENIQMAGDQLVLNAVNEYKSVMKSSMGIRESEFEELHGEAKSSIIRRVENSDRIKSKKCLQMFLQQLEAEIEDVYEELLKDLKQQREDILTQMQNAKNLALREYSDNMDAIFRDACQSPIQELKLENRHKYAKEEAQDSFESFLNGLDHRFRDTDEEELICDDLFLEIDDKFIHFQDRNQLLWSRFEAEARNKLSTVKEEYVAKVKNIIEDAFDEDDFIKKEESVKDWCRRRLRQIIDTNLTKPEFFESLSAEFLQYSDEQYEGFFETFRMKQDEDEIQVKAAFFEAKKYYNDEMEKIVQEKEWYPPAVLKQKSKDAADAAIETCRDEIDLTDLQERQLREHMLNLFVKYDDDNCKKYPRESCSVGIDLGTTYSCVAVYLNGHVTVIDHDGRTTIPSVVGFNDDHTIDVGTAAKDQYYRHPENTIFDAKRLIGRKFTDEVVQKDIKLWPFNVIDDGSDQPRIQVRGIEIRPEEISAKILARLKNIAEEHLLKPVLEAVVTVPAYFNDAQRQATRDAAQIAGLKVRILNEPTAAAIAYGLHAPDDIQRNVLIFDLGGGTFDVAVLQMKSGKINVKATGGDTHLGGEDFDNAMVKYIIDHVKAHDGIDLGRDRDSTDVFKKRAAFTRLGRIKHYCEQQKRLLSSANRTVINIDRIDDNYNLEVTITRELFEELNMPDFDKCIHHMQQTLEESKIDKKDIDDIVLVGGSTRIPKIREMIKEFFNGKALNIRINADEAVAYGAAAHAAILNGKQAMDLAQRMSLSDVAPLSVGIEVVTGRLSVVIPKNTPVPCSRTEIYHTASDNQTAADIRVFEGEKLMAVDNNFLGKFLLSNIPKAPRGQQPIDVNMNVDAEGILHVQAVSRNGRSTNSIDIETYNGRMTTDEISSARRANMFRW